MCMKTQQGHLNYFLQDMELTTAFKWIVLRKGMGLVQIDWSTDDSGVNWILWSNTVLPRPLSND